MAKMGVIVLLAAFLVGGCSSESITSNFISQEPEIKTETESGKLLRSLPPAKRKAVVAVYDFEDKTGQHKPNDKLAEFSRAVTQGGAAILNEALTKAGKGTWFRVIERKGLDHLLKERQIIAATREQYSGVKAKLPPMLYAGVLLEGGIVAYESNTVTGGLGARYLGIGANTEYRQDVVTVYLRAVNVQNGEILISTNASKTIFSSALAGNVFKFVAFDEILEMDSGFTLNEPPQFAVRQAIESAVYSLIMEGVIQNVWEFADPIAGRLEVQRYYARVYDRPLPKKRDVKPVKLERPSAKPATRATSMPQQIMQRNMQQPNNTHTPGGNAVVSRNQQLNLAPAQISPAASPRKSAIGVSEVAPLIRGSNSNVRYHRRVTGGKTKLYCTSAGCYPFPPQ